MQGVAIGSHHSRYVDHAPVLALTDAEIAAVASFHIRPKVFYSQHAPDTATACGFDAPALRAPTKPWHSTSVDHFNNFELAL
eukprot:6606958-Alexandrium_andersonii.AAC.1